MKGRMINAVRFWIKHQRPTLQKAKSLGMTQSEYTKEYIELVKIKIESEKNDLIFYSSHPRYSAQIRYCIEMLKDEIVRLLTKK